MKISKVFAAIFSLLGTAICVLTVLLCLNNLNKPPVLAQTPQLAVNRVESLFQALCSDDYAAASAMIYGNPELGGSAAEESGISDTIWAAFVDSLGYSLVGECYATDSGIAQKVQVSYLDIASVTDVLQERSRELLQQQVLEAEDMAEVYDENNEYRQDFVDQVVLQAARDTLKQDARYMETELTIHLAYTQGQWWILSDDALMQIISGGIAQ